MMLARGFLAAGSTPSKEIEKRDLVRRVRAAVAQLAEADQEILLLRTYEGLSNQEIGCILGIEPATASQRYGRAVLRLQKMLAAEGLVD